MPSMSAKSRRLIAPLIFGIAGVAVLLSLGAWQMRRLEWKLGLIAAIEARIHEEPVALPLAPDPEADRFLPVTVQGAYTGENVQVLSSRPGSGPGADIIAVLETDSGRRVLVDRGFAADAQRRTLALAAEGVTVTGNLIWPRDAGASTPPPDARTGLWFARAPGPIAAALGTEPLMIAARTDAAVPGLIPRPVTGADLRNDHLGYAITWFLLAAVWAGMTAFLLWRIRREKA